MARQQVRRHSHPDFRHRVPVPVPAVEEVEQQLPGFRANNAPLRDHLRVLQTRPGAHAPTDAKGQNAH